MRKLQIGLALVLFLVLFLIYAFVPIYEGENGKFSDILLQGNFYWHDGISPLVKAYFDNYLQNRNFLLPNTTLINANYNLTASTATDVVCSNGVCSPTFNNFGLHGFFEFSFWLYKAVQFNTLHYLTFVTILLYSISIVILFLTFNKIYPKKLRLNFILSMIVGLGTSFAIYSKYLFLYESFQTVLFALILYFLVSFEYTKHKSHFLFLAVSAVLFSSFFTALPSGIVTTFFILFLYYVSKKHITTKTFLLASIPLFLLLFLNTIVFINYVSYLSQNSLSLTKETNPIYNIYNQSLSAVDFTPAALSYSISSSLGNAIFLKSYSVIGFFFGPKGIFVNSMFLIFAFLAMFSFKPFTLRNKLLILLIFMVILVAYLNPQYEGGLTPRYVRHAEPIVMILSVFVLAFFANLKTRGLKNKLIIILFIILAVLSIANSISLSIRTDWNYEKVTNLISYDTVLWPWVNLNTGTITLDLTQVSEQAQWNLEWVGVCNPPTTTPLATPQGLLLGPCLCISDNSATRSIQIPTNINTLDITACATSAGGDGVMVYTQIDNQTFPLFLQSLECKDFLLNISSYADNKLHEINLSANVYGRCDNENVYFKQLKFENINETTPPLSPYNFIEEKNAWRYSGENNCNAVYFDNYIVTDPCSCISTSFAARQVYLPWNDSNIQLTTCAGYAGKDGTIGNLIFDNQTYPIFTNSNSCNTQTLNIKSYPGIHNITLESGQYGVCDRESTDWNTLVISNGN